MTSVIEGINVKIDKILQKLDSLDIRLMDLEIMVKTIEVEIQNKGKSFKRNKAIIMSRTEQPIKLNLTHYKP